MSSEILSKALSRINEHIEGKGVERVSILLHGGEPLLAGSSYIANFFETVVGHLDCQVDFGIQTNGTLVTRELVKVFKQYGVSVGISLDGPESANTKRVYHNNRTSFTDVISGWRLLEEGDVSRGILSTINLNSNPLESLYYFSSLEPNMVDFLWPLYNNATPPPEKMNNPESTPFADWLIKIFDEWWNYQINLRIRSFRDIIALLLGSYSRTETWGLNQSSLLVIEANGAYEGVDTLKSTFDGAPETGLNVFNSSINDVKKNPLITLRQSGVDGLPSKCKKCPVLDVCGGDYLPHRYHAELGFNAVSVYCADREKLVRHIRNRLLEKLLLAPERIQEINRGF